jgi:exonuclease-1
LGRNLKSKRLKKQEINIFSDDSIEEAMLNLPDFDGFENTGSRSNSKIQILAEQTHKPGEEAKFECLNQQGNDTQTDSQDTTPSMTTSMSLTSSAEQPPTPKEASPVPLCETLKSRFAFGATGTCTPKSYGSVHNLPTPSSTSPRPSRIPLAVKSNAPPSKISAKTSLTPLQRLGVTATNRLNLPATPPLTPSYAGKLKPPRRSLLSKGSKPFPEVEKGTEPEMFEPASIPLPLPDAAENAALCTQNGSEDMIIHDSEDSDALSPSPEDDYESTPQINFSRFAYIAAKA